MIRTGTLVRRNRRRHAISAASGRPPQSHSVTATTIPAAHTAILNAIHVQSRRRSSAPSIVSVNSEPNLDDDDGEDNTAAPCNSTSTKRLNGEHHCHPKRQQQKKPPSLTVDDTLQLKRRASWNASSSLSPGHQRRSSRKDIRASTNGITTKMESNTKPFNNPNNKPRTNFWTEQSGLNSSSNNRKIRFDHYDSTGYNNLHLYRNDLQNGSSPDPCPQFYLEYEGTSTRGNENRGKVVMPSTMKGRSLAVEIRDGTMVSISFMQ